VQVERIVDKLASLYAWIMKRNDQSWSRAFHMADDGSSEWEATIKSAFSLDTEYFTKDLIDRVRPQL
jgi:hypothetical protein